MILSDIITRVRRYVRDDNGSIFKEADIRDYANEAIDRFRIIPQLKNSTYLSGTNDAVTLIPEHFQYLIALYASSRCFFQDERNYQASTMLNEFEFRFDEFKQMVEDGRITIVNGSGEKISDTTSDDAVTDVYFKVTLVDSEVM